MGLPPEAECIVTGPETTVCHTFPNRAGGPRLFIIGCVEMYRLEQIEMKEENQKALEEFLARSEDIADDILEDSRQMFGNVPFILPVLRKRPDSFVLTTLGDELICRPRHLSAREAELAAIASAASLGADHCLKIHIRAAEKVGAGRDEILETIMIAGLIGKARILGIALRELDPVPGTG